MQSKVKSLFDVTEGSTRVVVDTVTLGAFDKEPESTGIDSKDSPAEKEAKFRAGRMQQVVAAMQKFLDNKSVNERNAPVIAFSYSGGGYRSMVASIGSTRGAERIGLYGGVMYSGGVSGGGWFQSQWYNAPQGETADQFATRIQPMIAEFPFVTMPDRILRSGQMSFQAARVRPINEFALTDIYGALLAQTWAGGHDPAQQKKSVTCTVSDQAALISDFSKPLPIYNVIRVARSTDELLNRRAWYEFTPYAMTAIDPLVEPPYSIDVRTFGSRFADGKVVDAQPEPSLASVIGVVGSAFCADIKALSENSEILRLVLLPFAQFRQPVDSPTYYNPCYKMDSRPNGNRGDIELVDAGAYCNCGFIPFFRQSMNRHVDVVFAFDNSETIEGDGNVLRVLVRDRKNQGLEVPESLRAEIEDDKKANLADRGMRVYETTVDEAKRGVPSVVYFPLNQLPEDQGEIKYEEGSMRWQTANFCYNKTDYNFLVGRTDTRMVENVAAIKKLLARVVARKS